MTTTLIEIMHSIWHYGCKALASYKTNLSAMLFHLALGLEKVILDKGYGSSKIRSWECTLFETGQRNYRGYHKRSTWQRCFRGSTWKVQSRSTLHSRSTSSYLGDNLRIQRRRRLRLWRFPMPQRSEALCTRWYVPGQTSDMQLELSSSSWAIRAKSTFIDVHFLFVISLAKATNNSLDGYVVNVCKYVKHNYMFHIFHSSPKWF